MSCDIIRLPCTTKGTDVTAVVTISDDSSPIDITGREVVVFDAHPEIDGLVTAEITDAASGVVTITIEGTSPIKAGVYGFRVQINNPMGASADSIGLPMFRLEVG